LPAGAVASVFVDPRFLERTAAASPRPNDPGQERVFALLGRYLAAVRFAGIAVERRDGIVVHTEEVVDPAKLDPALARWSTRTATPDPALARMPATALAFAVANLDLGVVHDAVGALVAERDRTKWENLHVALKGILLGLDARSQVARRVGPRLAVYVERPEKGRQGLPGVITAEVGHDADGAKVAEALGNAFRTLLAVHALDDKHGGGTLRLQTRKVGAAEVTALAPQTPLAFASAEGRFLLGSSAEAVARGLAAQADPKAGRRLERVRSAYFPGVESFACADLVAVHDFVDPVRPAVARRMAARQHRPEVETARDLDQALALIHLFDAAFLTSAIEPGFEGVHRSLGLVKLPGGRED
jgi:hypothetical protein